MGKKVHFIDEKPEHQEISPGGISSKEWPWDSTLKVSSSVLLMVSPRDSAEFL